MMCDCCQNILSSWYTEKYYSRSYTKNYNYMKEYGFI